MGRNASVSLSRGVAIILMVLSHASVITGYANSCVYLFHMPLFFVMSGICFKDEYLNDALKFTKRKLVGVYFPTVCFGLLFLVLHNVFFRLNLYNDIYGYAGVPGYLYEFEHFAKRAIILFFRVTASEELLGGYWFMYTLFFSSFIYYIMRRFLKNEFIIIAALVVIATLLKKYNLRVPFLLIGSREVVATTLIALGHVSKEHTDSLFFKIIVVTVGIVLILLGGRFWPGNMNNLTWQRLFLFVMTSGFASLAVYYICDTLRNTAGTADIWLNKLIQFAGDHSFAILTWHFLSFKVVSLCYIKSHSIGIEHLAEFPTIKGVGFMWNLLYFIVGVGLPLLATKLYIIIKDSVHENHPNPLYI